MHANHGQQEASGLWRLLTPLLAATAATAVFTVALYAFHQALFRSLGLDQTYQVPLNALWVGLANLSLFAVRFSWVLAALIFCTTATFVYLADKR